MEPATETKAMEPETAVPEAAPEAAAPEAAPRRKQGLRTRRARTRRARTHTRRARTRTRSARTRTRSARRGTRILNPDRTSKGGASGREATKNTRGCTTTTCHSGPRILGGDACCAEGEASKTGTRLSESSVEERRQGAKRSLKGATRGTQVQ
jgi:hypothetical protein